jgi:hypothetical protein
VTKVPPETAPSDLAATVLELLADADARSGATDAGLRFAAAHSVEATARQLLTLVLEPPWVDASFVASLADELVATS